MLDSTDTLASSALISAYATTGAAREVTFRANESHAQHQRRWEATLDKLLEWRMTECVGERTGCPNSIDSAIDLIWDLWSDQYPVPASVALTEDGGVSVEWRMGDEVVTIEIIESGVAELTRFQGGRVIGEFLLERNPRTRRLEQRGAAD